MSAANYFGLATPPRARFHVMVMAVMLPRQCHDVSKVMMRSQLCQVQRKTEDGQPAGTGEHEDSFEQVKLFVQASKFGYFKWNVVAF